MPRIFIVEIRKINSTNNTSTGSPTGDPLFWREPIIWWLYLQRSMQLPRMWSGLSRRRMVDSYVSRRFLTWSLKIGRSLTQFTNWSIHAEMNYFVCLYMNYEDSNWFKPDGISFKVAKRWFVVEQEHATEWFPLESAAVARLVSNGPIRPMNYFAILTHKLSGQSLTHKHSDQDKEIVKPHMW